MNVRDESLPASISAFHRHISNSKISQTYVSAVGQYVQILWERHCRGEEKLFLTRNFGEASLGERGILLGLEERKDWASGEWHFRQETLEQGLSLNGGSIRCIRRRVSRTVWLECEYCGLKQWGMGLRVVWAQTVEGFEWQAEKPGFQQFYFCIKFQ